MKIKVGQNFGKWQLIEKLGRGGNGLVWKVTSKEGVHGAIKLLHPRNLSDEKRYYRFNQEIEVMRKCQNISGILPLLDSKVVESPSSNNQPWFVSALAVTLETRLGSDYSLRDVVMACASYAETLKNMHQRGFSHRDIKPDNLFVLDQNYVIGDFGLVDFPDKTPLTREGEKLGPTFYIAPEMLNDALNADGKLADVYSLAKTLWKLGTGQNYPIPGELRTDVTALTLSKYIDEEGALKLDSLLEIATKHEPKQRLSMSDFANELQSWLAPPSKSKDVTDLTPLRSRLDNLMEVSNSYERQRQALINNNTSIEVERDKLLDAFDPCLNLLQSKIDESGWSPRSTRIKQGGRGEIWFGVTGENNPSDKFLFMNALQISIQPNPPLNTNFVLTFGINFGIPYDKTDLGHRYKMNEPIKITAAYLVGKRPNPWTEDECLWSDINTFLLNGPSKDTKITDLSNGLKQNFRPSIERFIEIVKSS